MPLDELIQEAALFSQPLPHFAEACGEEVMEVGIVTYQCLKQFSIKILLVLWFFFCFEVS